MRKIINHRQQNPKINKSRKLDPFVDRMIRGLIILIFVFSFTSSFLLILPFSNRLEKSLINTFSQVSETQEKLFEYKILKEIEIAKSISNRSAIKDAINEYKNNEINFEELKTYTQDKYYEGSQSIDSILKAIRIVDDKIIGEYTHENAKYLNIDEFRLDASHCIFYQDSIPHLYVSSEIIIDGEVVGYDEIIFELQDHLSDIANENVVSRLINNDLKETIIKEGKIIEETEEYLIIYRDKKYYKIYQNDQDINFATRINRSQLLKERDLFVRRLISVNVLSFVVALVIIYEYLVRIALDEIKIGKDELSNAISLVNTDPLTNLYSRRFIEELLSDLFNNYQRSNESPTIIMIDIDDLKVINDKLGHNFGDYAIRSIADALNTSIGQNAYIGRLGCDEFLGVFISNSKEEASLKIDEIKKAVSKIEINLEDTSTILNISIGMTRFEKNDLSIYDSINRADILMYQDKRNKYNGN